jgi:Na+-driven multidrug efflux pump
LKYTYAAAAILNVILNSIMIPLWGATGAGLASLITQIFTSIGLPAMIPDMRPNAKLMLQAIMLRGWLPEKQKE